jgi:hypothetical protein
MMDKSVAHGTVIFTPGSSSHTTEDMTSAYLPQPPSMNYPTVFVSYDVSPDQDAIFGSAGPYDDDWESGSDVDRDDWGG